MSKVENNEPTNNLEKSQEATDKILIGLLTFVLGILSIVLGGIFFELIKPEHDIFYIIALFIIAIVIVVFLINRFKSFQKLKKGVNEERDWIIRVCIAAVTILGMAILILFIFALGSRLVSPSDVEEEPTVVVGETEVVEPGETTVVQSDEPEQPVVIETTKVPIDTPIVTETIEPTDIPTPTPPVTETPPPTETPEVTPEVTPTSERGYYVGVLDLSDCIENFEEEFLIPLSESGFGYGTFLENSDDGHLYSFDVLYFPKGWYCKWEDLHRSTLDITGFLKNRGGLLIANPVLVDVPYEINFLPFKVIYHQITDEDYYQAQSVPTCYLSVQPCEVHWLIQNRSSGFPLIEVHIALPDMDYDNPEYYSLAINSPSTYPALVISSRTYFHPGRFVLLSGDARSTTGIEEGLSISEGLFINLLIWLGGYQPSNNWYQYNRP